MPASTSSNTSVEPGVAPPVSVSRSANIVRASSPPDATRVSGSSGDPGLAANRNVTWSPGSSASCWPTCTAISACGMRQLAQRRLHGRGQLRCRVPAGLPDRLRRGEFVGERQVPLCVERRGPGIELLQFVESFLRLGVECHDGAEIVAVLATQVLQQLPTFADRLEAFG